MLLPSSNPQYQDARFPIEKYDDMCRSNKSFKQDNFDDKPVCIAQARAPGFETYQPTGTLF